MEKLSGPAAIDQNTRELSAGAQGIPERLVEVM